MMEDGKFLRKDPENTEYIYIYNIYIGKLVEHMEQKPWEKNGDDVKIIELNGG